MPLGVRPFDPTEFGMDDVTYWRMENQFDNSSIQFAIEILPTLWSLLEGVNEEVTLLDVGARTGAGTHLIAYLHQTLSTSRFKIKATAMDIVGTYHAYAKKNYPFSNFTVGDIFKMPEGTKFDIVLCSHTIEHVEKPKEFLAQLTKLARRYVIIACPFGEEDLIPGHINSFREEFFDATGAISLKIYKALGWHQSMACIAVYAGSERTD
jgi:SAM-dependent methyltransferase